GVRQPRSSSWRRPGAAWGAGAPVPPAGATGARRCGTGIADASPAAISATHAATARSRGIRGRLLPKASRAATAPPPAHVPWRCRAWSSEPTLGYKTARDPAVHGPSRADPVAAPRPAGTPTPLDG